MKEKESRGYSPYLVDERASVQSRDLASSDVGYLEVGMQKQIKAKRIFSARVVHADIEVQLLLAQY